MLRETSEFRTFKRFFQIPDFYLISFFLFLFYFFLQMSSYCTPQARGEGGWWVICREGCVAQQCRCCAPLPGLYVMTKWLEIFLQEGRGFLQNVRGHQCINHNNSFDSETALSVSI